MSGKKWLKGTSSKLCDFISDNMQHETEDGLSTDDRKRSMRWVSHKWFGRVRLFWEELQVRVEAVSYTKLGLGVGGREIETCVSEREELATKILVGEAESVWETSWQMKYWKKLCRGDFAGRRSMYTKNYISCNSHFLNVCQNYSKVLSKSVLKVINLCL